MGVYIFQNILLIYSFNPKCLVTTKNRVLKSIGNRTISNVRGGWSQHIDHISKNHTVRHNLLFPHHKEQLSGLPEVQTGNRLGMLSLLMTSNPNLVNSVNIPVVCLGPQPFNPAKLQYSRIERNFTLFRGDSIRLEENNKEKILWDI